MNRMSKNFGILFTIFCVSLLLAPCITTRAMPADAKWIPSKEELSFEIIVLSWDTYSVDAGYAIEEALEEIGFAITINEMDDEVMYPLVYENGYYDVFNGTIVEEYRK